MKLIYTDLDGTLLDFHSYDHSLVHDTVHNLQQAGIPIVFCSSKTRAEQELIRAELHVSGPFIVENGSAIFVPRGYFSEPIAKNQHLKVTETPQYEVIELGKPVADIKAFLIQARQQHGLDYAFYADLPVTEVMHITGLAEADAHAAMNREYSETLLKGTFNSHAFKEVLGLFAPAGFRQFSGGRYVTVTGIGSDKGKAVQVLSSLFEQYKGGVTTAGIGDSANDMPMLQAVDKPFLVQKPNGQWYHNNDEHITYMPGIGPKGWLMAVESLAWL